MFNSQRTLYGTDLALCQSFGLEYNFKQGTTLNNFLDVLPKEQYPTGVYPTIKYICIGNGGDTNIDGTNYPFSQHQAKDAGLFNMVPFIARKLTEDLEDYDRKKYRLRKVLMVDDVEYVFYFLRVIDSGDIVQDENFMQFTHSDTQEEVMQPVDFVNSTTILRPVPVNKVDLISAGNTNYITKLLVLKLYFSQSEIEEINNAINLYSRTKLGMDDSPVNIITEIGVCHGVDKIVTEGKNYTEAIGVQINVHLGTSLETAMYLNNNMDSSEGITKSISFGGMEPLYVR